MELTIDRKELQKIVLAWAETSFPGAFNKATFGSQYGSDFCTLSKETEPEADK